MKLSQALLLYGWPSMCGWLRACIHFGTKGESGDANNGREGNGNPLQYSYLGKPMDRGPWWATVHGVAKSQTRLSNLHFTSSSY